MNKELETALAECNNKYIVRKIEEYFKFIGNSKRGIQQSLVELELIFDYLQVYIKNIGTYTEIGSCEGGSLWLFANNFVKIGGTINVVEINIREELITTINKLIDLGYKVNVFDHNDEKTAASIKETDMLFIDADHSYNGVKSDYDRYFPLIKNGGVCMLHDTVTFPGCMRLSNELKVKHQQIKVFSGNKCLHVLVDNFEQIKQERESRGLYDFYYKELEPGTTVIIK